MIRALKDTHDSIVLDDFVKSLAKEIHLVQSHYKVESRKIRIALEHIVDKMKKDGV